MKTNKKFKRLELAIDVVDYMFTKWLIRQGLFALYKENCEHYYPNHRSFHDNLCSKIRSLYESPVLGVDALLSTSFPFAMTPEGYSFWAEKSALWKRVCREFKSSL